MALIDSVHTTKVTVPSFLKGKQNGKLDPAWLRSPDHHTAAQYKLFVPVSYAMQALHLASKGILDDSTGRYRTYERQYEMFFERHALAPNCGCGSKTFNGRTYYLQRSAKGNCYAMAASPGTSNHGLACADDVAEESDGTPGVESMSDAQLTWMRDNAPSFGFGLETRKERWHWHWIGGDALNQKVVDTLYAHGITIPDMTQFGFYVPDPTQSPDPKPPKEDDDMPIFLAYTDTTSTGGKKQLWRGNGVECYSLDDPGVSGTDAYGLVRRNFATDVRVKGVYSNPNTRKPYETADEIITISPNQVRLDLGTPRSPTT